MGIDAGFDMVPRLTGGAVDRQNWQSFMKIIRDTYQDDDLVDVKPNYIIFKAGEHPMLPFEGHKFLRFSSKISGGHANGVEKYIDTVTQIAKLKFGVRIQNWNEAFDEWGHYSWRDVDDSVKSYEQVRDALTIANCKSLTLHQADKPESPTNIAEFVFGTDPTSEMNLPLFEIQPLPGKGNGLVARFNIARGKRILCEKPLFTTPNLSPLAVMEKSLATKLKTLSKTEQRQFLSLHNNFPGKFPFSGIMKTNALPCGPDSVIGGVYPTICRINHSCLPNAHNSWNSDAKCETIHAIRYIKSGEEITISYANGEPSDFRRRHLKNKFGFDCSCALCSLPLSDIQMSDARRLQIKSLDVAIGNSERVMNKPEDCLADCYLLLQVLEAEYEDGAGALTARLYYDAFQISITHGDQARASVFAERSHRSRVTCEGEDSPETKRIKVLMENPMAHRNSSVSRRWQTGKKLVPKGLNDEEFEKWLWTRGR